MSASDRVCSTHDTAFVEYGIENGTDLVHRTYYALREEWPRTVDVSPATIEAVTRSFRSAFVRAADVPVVPEHVEAAIPDAASYTAHEHLAAGTVDLRTALLPTFFRSVAALSCEYRHLVAGDGVDVEFEE